jgi:phage shock protein PspC (stress-responsive transcriptional regulator)
MAPEPTVLVMTLRALVVASLIGFIIAGLIIYVILALLMSGADALRVPSQLPTMEVPK